MKNIMKKAHEMTREIKKEFPGVDYKAQLGICISFLYEENKKGNDKMVNMKNINFKKKGYNFTLKDFEYSSYTLTCSAVINTENSSDLFTRKCTVDFDYSKETCIIKFDKIFNDFTGVSVSDEVFNELETIRKSLISLRNSELDKLANSIAVGDTEIVLTKKLNYDNFRCKYDINFSDEILELAIAKCVNEKILSFSIPELKVKDVIVESVLGNSIFPFRNDLNETYSIKLPDYIDSIVSIHDSFYNANSVAYSFDEFMTNPNLF